MQSSPSVWESIGTGIASGIASGLIVAAAVLVAEFVIRRNEKLREKNEALRIRFPNPERTIDMEIFSHLSHGKSIELMKFALGTPDTYSKFDNPIFDTSMFAKDGDSDAMSREDRVEGWGVRTHSYLYSFKNGAVKITSKDNQTIDSLTVLPYAEFSGEALRVFGYEGDEEVCEESDKRTFDNTKVTRWMVENGRMQSLRTRWDNEIAISIYLGPPTYDYETYFCYATKDIPGGDMVDWNYLIGADISGVCLSQNDTDVYYIFTQELR